MTDEEVTEVVNHGTAAQMAQAVAIARQKARRSMAWLGVAVTTAIILALLGLILVARSSSNLNDDNAKRFDSINKELVATRIQLAAATAVNLATDECTLGLQGQVRTAALEHQAAMGQLIIIISTVVPENRQPAVQGAVADLQEALTTYRAAVDQLTTWQALPASDQLPCPINPSG